MTIISGWSGSIWRPNLTQLVIFSMVQMFKLQVNFILLVYHVYSLKNLYRSLYRTFLPSLGSVFEVQPSRRQF